MSLFVNREEELESLRRRLDQPTPQLLRVYGRRRLGKTELLRRVAEGRDGLYLLLDEADRAFQLESLAHQVSRRFPGPVRAFTSWDSFLDQLESLRVPLVVLDEFQRLLDTDPQAITRIQARWDGRWRTEGPSLALCGSSVGMMQRLTGSRRGPLFGRLTGDLRLRPFDYRAARLFYPGIPEDEKVRRYAVFGGTPFYHTFSLQKPLEDAVRDAFLDTTAPLVEEPQELLRLELTSPARHNSILNAIGQGTHALRDLETKLGVRHGGLGPYLRLLREDLDLVAMENPVCGLQRPARYVFNDPFFAFYYRYVFHHRARIELGRTEAVWADIAADLDTHVGRVFEDVVRHALLAANGRQVKGHRLEADEVGRWWNRAGAEVDIVVRGPREVWVGEVKWSPKPVGAAVVDALLGKIPLLERVDGLPVRPFVAARGGVTEEAEGNLQRTGGFSLNLADVADLCEGRGGPHPAKARERPRAGSE